MNEFKDVMGDLLIDFSTPSEISGDFADENGRPALASLMRAIGDTQCYRGLRLTIYAAIECDQKIDQCKEAALDPVFQLWNEMAIEHNRTLGLKVDEYILSYRHGRSGKRHWVVQVIGEEYAHTACGLLITFGRDLYQPKERFESTLTCKSCIRSRKKYHDA